MQKEMFDNLLNSRGCATSTAFSAKEKDYMYMIMEQHEMSRGTAYNRLFRDGFKEWEVLGIEKVMMMYAETNDIPNSVFNDTKKFFANLETKVTFKNYMNGLGMGINTVTSHFTEGSFKKWEMIGIRQIVEQYFLNNELMLSDSAEE